MLRRGELASFEQVGETSDFQHSLLFGRNRHKMHNTWVKNDTHLSHDLLEPETSRTLPAFTAFQGWAWNYCLG
jgi:hypothetical protein